MNLLSQEHKEKINQLRAQYQHLLPLIFFSLGFGFDILTLGDIDDLGNIISLSIYVFVTLSILIIEYLDLDSNKFQDNKTSLLFYKYREDLFHFFTGSLLSAFTLFYFKSGSVANSFIFFIFMLSLLFLNEFNLFKKKGLIVRTLMLMLCLVSYLFYILPILSGTTSTVLFYISLLIASLICVTIFFILSRYKDRDALIKDLLVPQLSIVLIFVFLNMLRLIPPIPLSLKHIGIYHDVQKNNGLYITKDLKPWYKFWTKSDTEFNALEGDKIFVFTKVFAPGDFESDLTIHWLKEVNGELQTSDRIPMKVTGGRKLGFRGFAFKSNYTPGEYQVRIETKNGLEIGRINFSVELDQSNSERVFNIKKHI